jgi:hypothetical protein
LLLKGCVCVCVCVNFSWHPRSRFSGNVYTCFSVWTVEELIHELWSPSHGCACWQIWMTELMFQHPQQTATQQIQMEGIMAILLEY